MQKDANIRYAVERMLWRFVFVTLGVIFVVALVPRLWDWLSPFVIGIAVAAMLQPLIGFMQTKLHAKRGLAVAICVIVVLVLAFLLLYWFCSIVAVQVISVGQNAQTIVSSVVGLLQTATDKLLDMAKALPDSIGLTIRASLDDAFRKLSDAGMALAGGLVNGVVTFATSLPYAFIYANFLILAIIFITNRYEKIQHFFSKKRDNVGEDSIRLLRQSAGKGTIGYIRVQLLFSLLTLLVSWVFFQAVGFEYAFLIGFVAALLELIPQFGCGTLYIPWSVVCFIVGSTRNGWLVIGLYLVYSLLRRVTEPALLGSNLGVSPLCSLIGMFVGMRVAGVVGLILGPIAMVVLISAVRSHLFDGFIKDEQRIVDYMTRRWKRGSEWSEETAHISE
ncbi:MAG: sporulation integral membrane protein YtvI [Clostridia bacterium]